jgi:ABC-2 type transport system ATP-binding protein
VVVSGLERSVGRQRLLDGVDLRVPVGARLLLVSQPESAASLLLGILAGLARARRGRFELAGLSRADDPGGWRRRVAYLPPDGGFYPWLSPMEVLELAGRLAGYEREERARRIDAAVERYRLASGLRRPVSRGGPALAQKVGLAAAMIGDPEVLLLDEPLRALDDTERARLLRIPGRRRTVLLASRYPASEEGLVDQVALLRDGRLALHARRDELTDHGLPLSMKGIVALTELRAAAPPAAAGA